jgi:pilus assembly protein Flp/PilA
MTNFLRKLLRDDDGPTTVEYAVMLALIVAACLVSINAMAVGTASSFDASAAAIESAFGS